MQGRCVQRARLRCKNLSRAKECLWSQIYCIFPDSSLLQWWGTFPTWRFKSGKSPKNCSKAGLGVYREKVSSSLRPTTPFTFFFFYIYMGKKAEVNLMKRGCGHVWDRRGGEGPWPMVLVSVGVRLAPEVPLWCDCAEVALEPRGWGRERVAQRERGCVKFLFLSSLCKHETSSR